MSTIAHVASAQLDKLRRSHQGASHKADELTAGERQLLRASFRDGIGHRPTGPDVEHHLSLIADKLKGTTHNIIR